MCQASGAIGEKRHGLPSENKKPGKSSSGRMTPRKKRNGQDLCSINGFVGGGGVCLCVCLGEGGG